MRYIALPTINGEINGDPILLKYWYKAIKYVKGEKSKIVELKNKIIELGLEWY